MNLKFSNVQLAYKDYIEKHRQYFDKDFIKDKTLREIICELTRKMFINFGKSIFMCKFISDILLFVEENLAITKINRAKIKKVSNKIKNIRFLNIKIANEIRNLTKEF